MRNYSMFKIGDNVVIRDKDSVFPMNEFVAEKMKLKY